MKLHVALPHRQAAPQPRAVLPPRCSSCWSHRHTHAAPSHNEDSELEAGTVVFREGALESSPSSATVATAAHHHHRKVDCRDSKAIFLNFFQKINVDECPSKGSTCEHSIQDGSLLLFGSTTLLKKGSIQCGGAFAVMPALGSPRKCVRP